MQKVGIIASPDVTRFELFERKRCAVELTLTQATTEVSFGSNAQGTLQVIIIPTTKLLIAKKNPSLQEVGSSSGILSAISPAITGRFTSETTSSSELTCQCSVAVEEEEVIDVKQFEKEGREYYEVKCRAFTKIFELLWLQYELFTPYAQSGSHNLTTVCTSMVSTE